MTNHRWFSWLRMPKLIPCSCHVPIMGWLGTPTPCHPQSSHEGGPTSVLHNHQRKKKAANTTLCLLIHIHNQSPPHGHPNFRSRKRNLSTCLEGKRNVWWASINDYITQRTAIPWSFAGKIFTSLYILWIMNIHIPVKMLPEDWRLIKFDIWLYLPASWNILYY